MLEHSRWCSKRCTTVPFTRLQPVTPGNLTNLNFTQLPVLLQNSSQNQPNIDSLVATLPDSAQNENTVDSTGEDLKQNADNDEEEDELFQDLTHEIECQEERGPPIHKNLEQILQDLLRGALKKEKLGKVVMETLSPPKLENLEKTLVNPEIWRKSSNKTNSTDLRLQEIQKLVLKYGTAVAKIMNLLYESKQNQEASMLEVTKCGISCVQTLPC